MKEVKVLDFQENIKQILTANQVIFDNQNSS